MIGGAGPEPLKLAPKCAEGLEGGPNYLERGPLFELLAPRIWGCRTAFMHSA